MKFHLVDGSCGLYVSDERITVEPSFSPTYFSQNDFGWFRDELNGNWYKYDRQLQRVLCQKFGRNLPKGIVEENLSNRKTQY